VSRFKRSATITLLVVSSFDQKSGTLIDCRTTAALGLDRGAAGSTRSRMTTSTSYSPGSTENPRLTRARLPAPRSNSTGKIASTGYGPVSSRDSPLRFSALTYTSADGFDSCDASTVKVNGTNVPRCALTNSFCQNTAKSSGTDFPAIAASANANTASPSRR
jgi:hypothetical protein